MSTGQSDGGGFVQQQRAVDKLLRQICFSTAPRSSPRHVDLCHIRLCSILEKSTLGFGCCISPEFQLGSRMVQSHILALALALYQYHNAYQTSNRQVCRRRVHAGAEIIPW